MAASTLSGELKSYARSVGFDLVGITTAEPFADAERALVERIDSGLMRGLAWFTADRARFAADPRNHLPDAQSIVSLGMSYLSTGAGPGEGQTSPPTVGSVGPRLRQGDDGSLSGVVARYAWGSDYHRVVGDRLKLVAKWLSSHSGATRPTRLFVDTGRVIERAVAQRAGLGWFGKNTNILTRGYGSWVFLSEILTDARLEPDEPSRARCGSCCRCLEACPTGAIVAPGVLDNARCISFLTVELRGWIPRDLRSAMGTRVFGCDVCQDVCPVNRKARAGDHPEFAPSRGIGPSPSLLPLLRLAPGEFHARFEGTPIVRAKRGGLLRNAAVALGNLGAKAAVPALAEAIGDPDPVVRGHSAWALGRIGGRQARAALEDALGREEDPAVRSEIAQGLERSG